MDRVEFLRLPVRKVHHAERAQLEAVLLEMRDDLAGVAALNRIGFNDG
jgi:hypothetical protein